eukprot:2624190-Prymnesium_polylepis.1
MTYLGVGATSTTYEYIWRSADRLSLSDFHVAAPYRARRAMGERAGRAGMHVRRRVGIRLTHTPLGLSRGW